MSTLEDRTSSTLSVHCTEEGSQSTFFRATLRLRMCVRRRWVFERSQRILATELPTVPKPSRATLQSCAPSFCASTFCASTTAFLPVESSFDVPVIVLLSPKRSGGYVALRRTSNPMAPPSVPRYSQEVLQ